MAIVYVEFECDAKVYEFALDKKKFPIPGGKRTFTLKPRPRLYYLGWRMVGAEGNTMSVTVKIDGVPRPSVKTSIPRSLTYAGGVIKLEIKS